MPTTQKSPRNSLRVLVSSWLKPLADKLRDNRGTAAVTFILCLPIFLSFVAILSQYALLANGKLVVEHAAQAAARSAVTSLSEDRPDRVYRAAYMALAPVSPKVSPVDPEGTRIQEALAELGTPPFDSYAARYTFAKQATEVTWTSPKGTFKDNEGQPIELTVTYQLPLTVPLANLMLNQPKATVANRPGYYRTVTSTVKVMTSHSRTTQADGNGWPGAAGN